jgi:hypothetical protein
MTFTLNGAGLQNALVRVPRYGAATATATTAGRLDLTAGARVTLAVGDLSLVMSVTDGGTFGEQSTYSLTAGAGRWSAVVGARAHRSDGGITVAEVARDLAAEAGELGVALEAGAERPLGYAWHRPAGLASDALRALVGPAWWVAPDGVTHLGARPSRAVTPATLHLGAETDLAHGRAVGALTGDEVAQLLPGAVVSSSTLPGSLTVGELAIRVSAGAVEVELLGERPPGDMLAAFLASLTGHARGMAPQLYQVTDDAQGRASAVPAGARAAELAPLPAIDRAFGLPGAHATLQPGALVLVSLLDGSPGAPRVSGYLPGLLPLAVGLDAQTSIELGPAGGCSALARAVDVMANLNALRASIVGLGGSPSAMVPVATTLVKGK